MISSVQRNFVKRRKKTAKISVFFQIYAIIILKDYFYSAFIGRFYSILNLLQYETTIVSVDPIVKKPDTVVSGDTFFGFGERTRSGVNTVRIARRTQWSIR